MPPLRRSGGHVPADAGGGCLAHASLNIPTSYLFASGLNAIWTKPDLNKPDLNKPDLN